MDGTGIIEGVQCRCQLIFCEHRGFVDHHSCKPVFAIGFAGDTIGSGLAPIAVRSQKKLRQRKRLHVSGTPLHLDPSFAGRRQQQHAPALNRGQRKQSQQQRCLACSRRAYENRCTRAVKLFERDSLLLARRLFRVLPDLGRAAETSIDETTPILVARVTLSTEAPTNSACNQRARGGVAVDLMPRT